MIGMIGSVLVFVVVYALIASERIDRVTAAILGAAAVVLLHLVPYHEAVERVDLNVLFLVIGMMIVVGILADTGMFEWLAVRIAQLSNGRSRVIIIGLLTLTAVLSAFLDNVTTVILTAPITILLAQILELPAIPLLVLQAIFSNIGGTATLIGDPPNILIGSKGDLSFNDFLIHTMPITVIVFLASAFCVCQLFCRRITIREDAFARVREADASKAILTPRELKRAILISALIFGGFIFGHPLGVEPGIVAMCGAFAMVVACGVSAKRAIEKVEWDTVVFLIGLFMLVAALEYNGLFDLLGQQIVKLTGGDPASTTIFILWAGGLAAAALGAVPVTMAMIPLILGIVPEVAAQSPTALSPEAVRLTIEEPMLWALSLGACFGGNGLLLSTPASVVVAEIAQRNNYTISFWAFMRLGMPLTILSLLLSTVYLYVRYFAMS